MNTSIDNIQIQEVEKLNRSVWQKVNRAYIAKAIAELMHEKLAVPESLATENDQTLFRLNTDKPEVNYAFKAEHRALDFWHIHKDSLVKYVDEKPVESMDAAAFFIEMQQIFEIKPITLAHFVEETLNTLYADAYIAAKGRIASDELIDSDYQTIEHQMDGHPWATVNKGRIGFSLEDYHKYVPEADKLTQLFWVAVHESKADYNHIEGLSHAVLLHSELGEKQVNVFQQILEKAGLPVQEYFFMPVHEWQWQHKIVFLFASDIADKHIVPLGKSEDRYTPQQSIRTFFNVDNPDRFYVKTAISILNTSIFRGLSPKKLAIAPKVTTWVTGNLKRDAKLQQLGFQMLGEVATIGYKHSNFDRIENAPYHYKELFGVIWRESAAPLLEDEERMMTMASLLYIDDSGKPLVLSLIEKSGLTAEQWIRQYLKVYFTPIIHIFYRHQFFFSPHGENTILVMKDYVPQRIIIKDFVEEIVLTQEAKKNAPEDVRDILRDIDDEYATLFILSGIFDAVFRYLSNILHTYADYHQDLFWLQVRDVLKTYQLENADLKDRFERFDLFVPEFLRVCINRVRLLTYGYSENADIPVPEVCGTLPNPVA